MDTAHAGSVTAYVSAALAAVALLLAAFAGDGSGFDGVLPVGGFAVVLAAGFVVAFALGKLAFPRLGVSGLALVGALGLLVVWTGSSVIWSIAGDRSWDTFNRGVSYVAFLVLGVALAGVVGGRAARLTAALLTVVTAAVLTWSLVTKVFVSLDPVGERVARLQEPVDYWNALALLADVGVALALWLGASRDRRPLFRVAGALLAYVATLALLLTLSRVGVVAGVVAVVLWFALSRERVEGGLLLAASCIPAGLVAGWAFTRPALVEAGASEADRATDGRVFGVLALLGAIAVAGVATVGLQRGLGARRRLAVRALLGGAAALAVACIVALAVAIGNPVTWFDDEVAGASCSEVVNDPSRLGSLDFNNRWCWWNEAADVFAFQAPLGAGAGTFEIARKRDRPDGRSVLQPHSAPMQQLADGGVVALGLFLALVLAAAAVCIGAVRRLEGVERAAAVALVAAPAAFLVHVVFDYTWDFVAVVAPTMVALGVLAGAGRGPVELRRRPLAGVAAVLVALVVLGSFASPRLAERDLRASTRALDARDFAAARERAERALALNPLSIAPIHALARIDERQRRLDAAEERYVEAVELQPENPETWYFLGLFQFYARGNLCGAYQFLNASYTLDGAGNQWQKGGPLDVARSAVDRGACEPD